MQSFYYRRIGKGVSAFALAVASVTLPAGAAINTFSGGDAGA